MGDAHKILFKNYRMLNMAILAPFYCLFLAHVIKNYGELWHPFSLNIGLEVGWFEKVLF